MTLAKINNMLPEDGCYTETCRSNFNVNFNVVLSKYIFHPMVKIKKTLIISRCTVQLWKKTKINVWQSLRI